MRPLEQPTKSPVARCGVAPSESEQAAVKALIQTEGESAARASLNLDTTLARVAAGLSVRRGTLALVRERLRALASTESGQAVDR